MESQVGPLADRKATADVILAGGYKFLFVFFGCLVICAVLQQIYLRESRHVPLEEMAAYVGPYAVLTHLLNRALVFGVTKTKSLFSPRILASLKSLRPSKRWAMSKACTHKEFQSQRACGKGM
jgi:hypothetical protein